MVYYPPPADGSADLALMRHIDERHLNCVRMGARGLPRQPQREGVAVGWRDVVTLAQRMGIEALASQPGTSEGAPGYKIYPYLLGKGCQLSMDARGVWCDNGIVQRFWRGVKCERVHFKTHDSVSAAHADMAQCISWHHPA